MTKKIIRGLSVLAFVMACVIACLSINSSIRALDNEHNFIYHFQVIVDKDMDETNRKELVEGCYEAGVQENAFIEVIESIDERHKLELIEKAIYSKVDGIAYNAEVKEESERLAKKAAAVDIPIVNYGLTGNAYKNISDIQVSPYNMAVIMASDIKNIVKESKLAKDEKILLLLKECNTKDKSINDKFVKGFNKTISSKYNKLIKIVRVNAEKYDVNSKLKSQIEKNKKAKVIVCFDEEYTNVASAIYANKENNKDAIVIGYGATYNNIDAVKEKNIKRLFGVKMSSVGYNSIKFLCDKKNDSNVNKEGYIPIFQVIKLDKENNIIYGDVVSNNS